MPPVYDWSGREYLEYIFIIARIVKESRVVKIYWCGIMKA